MVGIYISINLQPSVPLHSTSVCGPFLHSALHGDSQNSVLFHKIYQNTGKPQLSYVDLHAGVMLHNCRRRRCAQLLCKRNLFLENSTLVPNMLTLPSFNRSTTDCPNVKNLSHILVISSSVMNRHIRKLWTELETCYRKCILWYKVKKNTMLPWDSHTDCGWCKHYWNPLSNTDCGWEPMSWAGMY